MSDIRRLALNIKVIEPVHGKLTVENRIVVRSCQIKGTGTRIMVSIILFVLFMGFTHTYSRCRKKNLACISGCFFCRLECLPWLYINYNTHVTEQYDYF